MADELADMLFDPSMKKKKKKKGPINLDELEDAPICDTTPLPNGTVEEKDSSTKEDTEKDVKADKVDDFDLEDFSNFKKKKKKKKM